MPTVYRLENAKGEGPFVSGAVANAVGALADILDDAWTHDPRNGRAPWEDGLRDATCKHYSFGCRTLRQYRNWFSHQFIREELATAGYVLNKYRVPPKHVMHGSTQSAFDRCKATLVATRAP